MVDILDFMSAFYAKQNLVGFCIRFIQIVDVVDGQELPTFGLMELKKSAIDRFLFLLPSMACR